MYQKSPGNPVNTGIFVVIVVLVLVGFVVLYLGCRRKQKGPEMIKLD